MFLVHATLGLSINFNLFINPKISYKKRILLLIEIQGLVSGDYKIYILTFEIEKKMVRTIDIHQHRHSTPLMFFCQRKSCSVIGNKNSIYKLQQHHHLYQTDDHSVPVKRQ